MTETTAVATRQAPPPLTTGGKVLPIVPKTVEEMFRIATAYAASGLAPKTLDSKEKVFIAIMAGAELGLPPHQAVQAFYVVNNRPTIWGDAIPALLWANGFKLKEWYENEDPAMPDVMVAKCIITRPDGEQIPGEYSVADAKKAKLTGKDGPWQTNPKRMLKMRARAFAARDGASDVLKGFQIREEVEDYSPAREVGPVASGIMARLEQHGHGKDEGFSQARVDEAVGADVEVTDAIVETIDEETGEITETQASSEDQGGGREPETAGANNAPADGQTTDDDDFPGDQAPGGFGAGTSDSLAWSGEFNREIEAAESVAAIDALTGAAENVERFSRLEAVYPGAAKTLNAAIKGRRKALLDRERNAN